MIPSKRYIQSAQLSTCVEEYSLQVLSQRIAVHLSSLEWLVCGDLRTRRKE